MWSVLEPGRTFVHGWSVEAICEHLEAVTAGEILRLLINVPPGCMKSLTTNVFWPAWEWGPRDLPHTRYVSASYSQDLTVRDNRRCRSVISSEAYQAMWGDRFQLLPEQNAKVRFDNNHTGFKIATSVKGVGTGERGDRVIIDDPHNIKDVESDAKREEVLQWFTEVIPTRVNDAHKSARVIIMQRVHERDTSGLIIKDLDYTHLCLPMEYEQDYRTYTVVKPRYMENQEPEWVRLLKRETDPLPRWLDQVESQALKEEQKLESWDDAPFEISEPQLLYRQDPRTEENELLWAERFSRPYLETDLKPSLRAWGGTYAEAGQLQQRPAPRGGGMFQRDDINIIDIVPVGGRTVRGWDLAATKDGHAAFTVGVRMQRDLRGRVIVTDVKRFRGTPHEVEEALKNCAKNDGPLVQQDIPQDPGQSGKAQKTNFATLLHGRDFTFSPESGSKEDRAKPLAAQSEAGNLYMVRAGWNDALISEMCIFPNGQFKDQVDAASRAYANLVRRRPRRIGGGMFQRDDINIIDIVPVGGRTVRGWDLAATKDGHAAFTVGVRMQRDLRGRVIVTDVKRFRGTPHEVEEALKNCAKNDGPLVQQDIPQDPGQSGKAQKTNFATLLHGRDFTFSPESGSKEDRAKPLAAQSEAGNLYMVRAGWNDALISEMCIFPNGQFKDQVDAASRAYANLVRRRPRRIGAAPEVIHG